MKFLWDQRIVQYFRLLRHPVTLATRSIVRGGMCLLFARRDVVHGTALFSPYSHL